MPNAAHDLADILEGWRSVSKGTTVRLSRGFDRDTVEAWREQVHAASLLRQVDQYLASIVASGKSMDHYLRTYPTWAMAVFAPDVQWNSVSGSPTSVADQQSVDLLRSLGDIIEYSGLSVSMSQARVETSLEAIDELLDCLNDPAVHLSEVERRYVFELITSIQHVLSESRVLGSVDLVKRVHELLGVMTMLAETLAADSETENVAKKVLRAVRRVVPYATFGAKVGVGTIGVAADILQIASS